MAVSVGTPVAERSDAHFEETCAASRESLEVLLRHHVKYTLGKEDLDFANEVPDLQYALSLAVRDKVIDEMIETQRRYAAADAKRVYYLSMDFLMGRSLGNNLFNTRLFDSCRELVEKNGGYLEQVLECEPDAALGNGGSGRAAACLLDSMATAGIPGFGYGINYEYGLFKQEIRGGYQYERPNHWNAFGTPWEIPRPREACIVPLYGRMEERINKDGQRKPMWVECQYVIGVPHDFPIVGFGGRTVNWLRLFSARSSDEFDVEVFNEGDYLRAVSDKIHSEDISKVLYPSDSVEANRERRLIQEYFLCACAARDITRRFRANHDDWNEFPQKAAIHLNETHPALTIVELMRILIDEECVNWNCAWEITQEAITFTNHTLLPEALERWPVELMGRVIPRHLQIIYEINRQFLKKVETVLPEEPARHARLSLVEEGFEKRIRMANLAILGSHAVNGVSQAHSELLRTRVAGDFATLFPGRFHNKTNGVTPRRWICLANPPLAELITSVIGETWPVELEKLEILEAYVDDDGFLEAFGKVKRRNKEALSNVIADATGDPVNPDSLFDVQVTHIHECKRQLLNVMHVIREYLAVVEDGVIPHVPRTYLFGGKAAPGYWVAKQIIKLINNLSAIVNRDERVGEWMKVVFIPDYRVTLAEKIVPAADISEQISTPGYDASGTGSIKFAMNGALTIGTLDGANIEIRDAVGADNIFTFGRTATELAGLHESGRYDPWMRYRENADIRRVMDTLKTNRFCPAGPGLFEWLFSKILDEGDTYFHLEDLPSYLDVHAEMGSLYEDSRTWTQKAILNVARIHPFSSDRTVREYARETWRVKPVL